MNYKAADIPYIFFTCNICAFFFFRVSFFQSCDVHDRIYLWLRRRLSHLSGGESPAPGGENRCRCRGRCSLRTHHHARAIRRAFHDGIPSWIIHRDSSASYNGTILPTLDKMDSHRDSIRRRTTFRHFKLVFPKRMYDTRD